MTLSNELLAVLDAIPDSISQTLNHDYRSVISINSDALNALDSTTDGTWSMGRSILGCKACVILFGERAVLPQAREYQQEQQRNWLVDSSI